MSSKLGIVNAALLETGNGARQIENDGSCESLISEANYRMVVEAELESFPYSFARKAVFVESRVAGDFGFPVGFQLPGESLNVARVFEQADKDSPPSCGCKCLKQPDWEEVNCILYLDDSRLKARNGGCEVGGVWVEFSRCDIDETRWPANFVLGVKYRLAAIFSRGINEESGEGDRFEALADRHFIIARQRSSRQRGNQSIQPCKSRLIRIRQGYRHG